MEWAEMFIAIAITAPFLIGAGMLVGYYLSKDREDTWTYK